MSCICFRLGNVLFRTVLCNLWVALALDMFPTTATADEQLPLIYADDFESGMDHWQTTDPAEPFWEITTVERNGTPTKVLRVTGQSNYQPPQRSPHSIALLKDIVVGDLEMTVDLQNTKPMAGPHRDLCLFFGYQDPAHFYYVHLGAESDPHAGQIFVVDEADRLAITVDEAEGTPWTNGWHTARVVRRVADGTIEIYFDDMETPLMTASDKRFASGQVGLGTFDDNGNWDDFELRGIVPTNGSEGTSTTSGQ